MKRSILLALMLFAVTLNPVKAQQNPDRAQMCLSSKEMKEKAAKYVMPKYPLACKCDGITTIWILVSAEGKVERVVALRGHPLTRASAAMAVKDWVFNPLIVDGAAVVYGGYLDFRFTSDGKVSLEESESKK